MEKATAKKIVKILMFHLIIGAIVTAIVLFTKGFCPIKAIFGFDCPGCGLTRAYLAFFHGDFAGAIKYHPMFWAVPPMIIIVAHINVLKKYIGKWTRLLWAVFFALAVAYLCLYVVKLIAIF